MMKKLFLMWLSVAITVAGVASPVFAMLPSNHNETPVRDAAQPTK